jgi:hypothetical protein
MVHKELDIVRFIRGQRKLKILVDSVTTPATIFNLKNTKKAIILIDDEFCNISSNEELKIEKKSFLRSFTI